MYEAAIKGVEATDTAIGIIYDVCIAAGYTLFVTADHGNAEQMFGEGGQPHTAHTCNKVPFIMAHPTLKLKSEGALCDVAPTMLELMGLEIPLEMTGESLFLKPEAETNIKTTTQTIEPVASKVEDVDNSEAQVEEAHKDKVLVNEVEAATEVPNLTASKSEVGQEVPISAPDTTEANALEIESMPKETVTEAEPLAAASLQPIEPITIKSQIESATFVVVEKETVNEPVVETKAKVTKEPEAAVIVETPPPVMPLIKNLEEKAEFIPSGSLPKEAEVKPEVAASHQKGEPMLKKIEAKAQNKEKRCIM